MLAAIEGGSAQATLPSGAGSDQGVRRSIELALQDIQRARCENGRSCAPATDVELSNPPISIAEARGILSRGVLSASAQVCGLDWQMRNFGPMMVYWRSQKKSERQMALIALLHGIMQSQVVKILADQGCTETIRVKSEASIDFRP